MSKTEYIELIDEKLCTTIHDHIDRNISIVWLNLIWNICKENGWNPVEVMGGVV